MNPKFINNNKRRQYKKVTYSINTGSIENEKFKIWDYYVPIRVLGTGAYAVVIEAKDTRFNGRHVAIKKNRNVFADLSDAKRILREISLLMQFSHDDIIQLTGVIPPDEGNQATFDDVYLIMPRMETTLHHVIKSKQELTQRHYVFFIYQILRGLKYIHSAGIAHRDLKPENILINCKNCNIRIIDFGLATFTVRNNNLTEYVVTRWYRAPEVMLCAKQYGVQVDMWSVGCIFGELVIRNAVFPGKNHFEQLSLIFTILGTPQKHELEWITSGDAKKYVASLPYQKGHDLRKIFKNCSAEEIDLIKSMLQINPKKRINVNQALSHPYFVKVHDDETEGIIDKNEFDKQIAHFHAIENKHNSLFGLRHLMYQTLLNFDPYAKKMKLKQSRLVQTERASNHKKGHPLYKPPDSC